MSKPSETKPPHSATLADYIIRYDLAAMLEEARQDYSQSAAGGPRLLAQEDIAARFRKIVPPKPQPHE